LSDGFKKEITIPYETYRQQKLGKYEKITTPPSNK
ncbi:hypothetical protein LCGC14_1783140, partial [marine sediment metagenome]